MNRIITYTTDWGRAHANMGLLKLGVHQKIPSHQPIDFSLSVSDGDVLHAAQLIKDGGQFLPEGVVHIILVGVFKATGIRLVFVKHAEQYYILPDNGLIYLLFGGTPDLIIDAFLTSERISFGDIECFVEKSIQHIESGLEDGTIDMQVEEKRIVQVRKSDNRIDCNVIDVDRFGNITLNIDFSTFSNAVAGKEFKVEVPKESSVNQSGNFYKVTSVTHSYSVDEPLFLRVKRNGLLELGLFKKSLIARFDYDAGNRRNLTNIQISFFLS